MHRRIQIESTACDRVCCTYKLWLIRIRCGERSPRSVYARVFCLLFFVMLTANPINTWAAGRRDIIGMHKWPEGTEKCNEKIIFFSQHSSWTVAAAAANEVRSARCYWKIKFHARRVHSINPHQWHTYRTISHLNVRRSMHLCLCVSVCLSVCVRADHSKRLHLCSRHNVKTIQTQIWAQNETHHAIVCRRVRESVRAHRTIVYFCTQTAGVCVDVNEPTEFTLAHIKKWVCFCGSSSMEKVYFKCAESKRAASRMQCDLIVFEVK